jgi:formate dehydrogenase subunit delta
MSPETLVRMANQIATAFAPQGEGRAVPGIADHINKFWDPRMRAAMAARLAAGGAGLHPLALKALAENLAPPRDELPRRSRPKASG